MAVTFETEKRRKGLDEYSKRIWTDARDLFRLAISDKAVGRVFRQALNSVNSGKGLTGDDYNYDTVFAQLNDVLSKIKSPLTKRLELHSSYSFSATFNRALLDYQTHIELAKAKR